MNFRTLLFCAVTGFSTQFAHATLLGLSTDPMGSAWERGDANSAFAVWDTYPSTSFSTDAAGSAGGFLLSNLAQNTTFTVLNQGAGVYNNVSTQTLGDDVLNTGGNGLSFSLTGTTSFFVQDVYLQVKRTSSQNLSTAFSPTVNGIAAEGFTVTSGTGDTTSSSGNWTVTTWHWSSASLSSANINSLTIAFGSNPGHLAIDAMAVDVSAIPEPSTWALLGLCSTGAMIFGFRRKKSLARVS